MRSAPAPAHFSLIEELISRDVGRGTRVLSSFAVGSLGRAVASLLSAPDPRVVLLTGFWIGTDPEAAETDGPLGAVQLAKAVLALGASVAFLTDAPCKAVVQAAIKAAGIECPLEVAPLPHEVGLESYERWEQEILQKFRKKLAITHVVAVERSGPTTNGTFRNMHGKDISSHTAPLDRVFSAGPWTTIGIGDGGNELGMGSLPPDLIASAVSCGSEIASVVGCDALLIGGTSNWGAAGLVAGLALASPIGHELLPALKPSWSRSVLTHMVSDGGAVDGVLMRPSISVDGVSWPDYSIVLKKLEDLVKRSIP